MLKKSTALVPLVLLAGAACGPDVGGGNGETAATSGSTVTSANTTSDSTAADPSQCVDSELPPPFCHVAQSYGSTLEVDSDLVPTIRMPLVGTQYPARLLIDVDGQLQLVDATDFSIIHGTSDAELFADGNLRHFVGDFNGDGIPDLGVADLARGPVRLYDGVDLGLLATGPAPTMPSNGNEFPSGAPAAAIDANADGIDEVITVELGHDLAVWRVEFGTLKRIATYEDVMDPCPGVFARGNFNGVGTTDLAIVMHGTSCWDGLELEDASSFTIRLLPTPTPKSVVALPAAPQHNAGYYFGSGDLDGDGMSDILLLDGMETTVLRSDGVRFKRVESVPHDTLGISGGTVPKLGDIDGDGRFEIALAGFTSESLNDEERIYWGEPLGHSFHAFPPYLNIDHLADLNGDGRAEIVATQIFPNAGKETLIYWSQ